ncbi:diamine N-acetyltransferase [Fragilaria crotonensis]|nr:diamine N-acetyltransferase [Fragilaria crotonensis]
MMNPVPAQAMSVDLMHKAIVASCHETNLSNGSVTTNDSPTIFRLGAASDMPTVAALLQNDACQTESSDVHRLIRDFDQVYWIVVEERNNVIGFAAVYWGYSTWDGRCLHANRIFARDEVIEIDLLRTLADIAVRLEGQRLVWQHFGEKSPLYQSLGSQVLDNWLTLRMNAAGMDCFLSNQQHVTVSVAETQKFTSVDASIQEALGAVQSNNVELHHATMNDLHHVERLVNGLAVYEKEVDAIHVNEQHYLVDGKCGDDTYPLYKCLLLWDKKEGRYFGMAFFYFGYDVDTGLFLYLEDLFIEESMRGHGCGTLVMATLALIAKGAGCVGFVWQALDWNTPALTFYGKIGANVQHGLLTARFCGETLTNFVKNRTTTTISRA